MTSEAISSEIIEKIKEKAVPKHVAIIMDGNGRWAQQRGKARIFGHQKGVESVHACVEIAIELGISVLTLYAFSEENWGRPKAEIAGLMTLLETYMKKERKRLHEANVRFHVIGNLEKLPSRTRRIVLETQDFLSSNTGLVLNIALSYSGHSEITEACKSIATKVQKESLKIEEINPDLIAKHLWTAEFPNPELFIRTSGELRISNFLLWQIAYTELWFSSVYWPDFKKEHFCEAIHSFQSRKRRFGLVLES